MGHCVSREGGRIAFGSPPRREDDEGSPSYHIVREGGIKHTTVS